MSERRRKKNPRFLKETSDRSGFDSWSRNDEGSFTKKWQGIKQDGLLLEPEEYDMPPPSKKPLGGADISGVPRADSDTYSIPPESAYLVQYLGATDTIALQSQSPIMISGSNTAITAGGTPVIAAGNSNGTISILCVGSNVTINSSTTLLLRTSVYVMDSGSILSLRYDTGTSTWNETSRDHQYYSLGQL